MPVLKGFRGFRYAETEKVGDLICPPYDIISNDEQDALYQRHPHNAIRLELAKERGTEGYGKVAAELDAWIAEGVITPEASDALYVYRQDFEHGGERRRVVGVIGALQLEEFGEGSGVLPHERTMEGPKADRLALLGALKVNVSPIYGIYRGSGALSDFYGTLEHRPTAARTQDDHGILHRLWVITAPAEVELLSAAVAPGPLVIADGHHRYETALAFHRSDPDGAPGSDSIMCFCVDADSEDLVVLPYNRAAKLNGDVDAGKTAREHGGRESNAEPSAALAASGSDHPFVFVTGDEDVLVQIEDAEVVQAVGERAQAWRNLDVVALHEALLPKLFPEGVAELLFSKDPEEIRRLVSHGEWDLGILLKALQASQIVDVARSGERMPQKASYFWPKAATGLVFRSLR